jgi:hypothetical protein
MQTLYLDGLTVFFVPSFSPLSKGKRSKAGDENKKKYRREEDCEFEREEAI